jgi:hypothetical protein
VDSLTPTIISMTTTDPKQLVLQEELPTVVTTSNLVFPTKKSSTAILLLSNVFHANLIHKYTRIEVVFQRARMELLVQQAHE